MHKFSFFISVLSIASQPQECMLLASKSNAGADSDNQKRQGRIHNTAAEPKYKDTKHTSQW